MTLLSLLSAGERKTERGVSDGCLCSSRRNGKDVQLSSKSPCLITCSYWAFLRSRRFVSTIPLTLSIVQLSRPDEMSRERSLMNPNKPRGQRPPFDTRPKLKLAGATYLSMNS